MSALTSEPSLEPVVPPNEAPFQMSSPHLLDATQRSWRLWEAGTPATGRKGWWQCCQSQPEDAPHPSWWPDCERRIHLQARREAKRQVCLFFLSVNGWSITAIFLCRPIISPAMKRRLTAQAMHSFLLARCLASLSGPDGESVCWQSRSHRHSSPSSEALWLRSEAESLQVSSGELILEDRTAGFPTRKLKRIWKNSKRTIQEAWGESGSAAASLRTPCPQ